MSAQQTTDFGRLLSEYRERLGWSKAQLAERAGLDASSVSRLEGGSRSPERGTVADLARALELTPLERERLLGSAGFRSDAWDDPLLVELVELILDSTLPEEIAADVRTLIRVAVEHGRHGRRKAEGGTRKETEA